MNPIHHISLSVTDLERSAHWYQQLFGEAQVVNREGEGWTRVRMNWPTGLVLSLTRHDATDAHVVFSHVHIGLDHIGLNCASQDEVLAWKRKLEDLGFTHGPLEDVAYAWAVTARDPDNIAIEFFCGK